MRKGIPEALEDMAPGKAVFLVAPTGYGKTSAIHHSWGKLRDRWGRVIHVLPLRALVSEVAKDAVRRGVPLSEVGYQAMIEKVEMEEGKVEKAPYLFSRYTVTTYDSYLFTLYLAPVAEASRFNAHRDTGLMSVATAATILDEVHLVLGIDGGEGLREEEVKAFTSLVTTLRVLTMHLKVRVLAVTATLPKTHIQTTLSKLGEWGVDSSVHVCLGRRGLKYYDELPNLKAHGLDEAYEALYDRYRGRVLTRVSKGSLIRDVEEVADSSRSVLVFCNTVSRAVEVYRALKGEFDAILIHSRLTDVDKRAKLREIRERLNSGKELVVVSTQCLEAGADFDFDTVVTEVAPPGSLIQRAGRGYRRLNERLGGLEGRHVAVIVNVSQESRDSASKVYPKAAVTGVAKALTEMVGGEGFFDWRFAEEKPCFVDLIDSVEYAVKVNSKISKNLIGMVRTVDFDKNFREYLEKLEKKFRGSLLREGAIIPLLTDSGVVAVSTHYLARKAEEILELEDDFAKAICETKEGLEERKVNRWRLIMRPLTTITNLPGQLLGIKVKEGVYSREVGLP